MNHFIYSQIDENFKEMNLYENKLKRMPTCNLVSPFLEFFFISRDSLQEDF
jgi:hypothetical protein